MQPAGSEVGERCSRDPSVVDCRRKGSIASAAGDLEKISAIPDLGPDLRKPPNIDVSLACEIPNRNRVAGRRDAGSLFEATLAVAQQDMDCRSRRSRAVIDIDQVRDPVVVDVRSVNRSRPVTRWSQGGLGEVLATECRGEHQRQDKRTRAEQQASKCYQGRPHKGPFVCSRLKRTRRLYHASHHVETAHDSHMGECQ